MGKIIKEKVSIPPKGWLMKNDAAILGWSLMFDRETGMPGMAVVSSVGGTGTIFSEMSLREGIRAIDSGIEIQGTRLVVELWEPDREGLNKFCKGLLIQSAREKMRAQLFFL